MTDHLDDVCSDLSVFHRIADAGELEAAVFFRLACRLPAYHGAMTAAVSRPQGAPAYEAGSRMHNNARSAQAAAPATAGTLAALNASLGGGWFSHRTVAAG